MLCFHFLETILRVKSYTRDCKILLFEWSLASKNLICRFYDKEAVISHPLSDNLEMWKLPVILVIISVHISHNSVSKNS